MTADSSKVPLLTGQPASLRNLGYDERWLQDWLADAPSRLGLGSIRIVEQEQNQTSAGILDLLARDEGTDTYYSIEVQLGEVDASHSFRVFDYWARNRVKYPNDTHVAVLIAENVTGSRYNLALSALAETVPLIVIEMRAWRGESEALLIPEIVIANEALDLSDTSAATSLNARTEADWRTDMTDTAWAFKEAFIKWATDNLGRPRISYEPASYIGVRYGRRVWAPLWPRKDGAYIYLPDPDGAKKEPSLAFQDFESRLAAVGLEASWVPKYNAGSNPIGVRLTIKDLERPEVQELLRASYQALSPGAEPYSERIPSEDAQ